MNKEMEIVLTLLEKSDRHMDKGGVCIPVCTCTCVTEYYSTMRNKDMLLFATVWAVLEDIMLSKINQTEKDEYYVLSLIRGF